MKSLMIQLKASVKRGVAFRRFWKVELGSVDKLTLRMTEKKVLNCDLSNNMFVLHII